MPMPRLGIPFHPKYANAAFEKTVQVFQKKYLFEISLLNWQHFDENRPNEIINKYGRMIDGLLLPGGHYGLDLKLFDSDERDNNREKLFKTLLFQQALKKGMPVLGICAGHWLMNQVLGGTVELLPKNGRVNHDVLPLNGALAHTVTVQPQTHLHDILCGRTRSNDPIVLEVNSWHHAANKEIADKVTVSARSDDGIVEGMELPYPGNPNCLSIQFHPEYLDQQKNPREERDQRRIIDAFRQASMQFQHKHQVNIEIRARFFSHDTNGLTKAEPKCGIQAKL